MCVRKGLLLCVVLALTCLCWWAAPADAAIDVTTNFITVGYGGVRVADAIGTPPSGPYGDFNPAVDINTFQFLGPYVAINGTAQGVGLPVVWGSGSARFTNMTIECFEGWISHDISLYGPTIGLNGVSWLVQGALNGYVNFPSAGGSVTLEWGATDAYDHYLGSVTVTNPSYGGPAYNVPFNMVSQVYQHQGSYVGVVEASLKVTTQGWVQVVLPGSADVAWQAIYAPEPSSLLAVISGLACLGGLGFRRRR